MPSSPAVANGVVYVGSDDNNTYALDATTGAKLWNYTTGGWVPSSPAVANGIVYVQSCDGYVYAISNGVVSGSSVGHASAVSNVAAALEGVRPVNVKAATSQSATPGFEVVLALVGLVIAAYIVRRRG